MKTYRQFVSDMRRAYCRVHPSQELVDHDRLHIYALCGIFSPLAEKTVKLSVDIHTINFLWNRDVMSRPISSYFVHANTGNSEPRRGEGRKKKARETDTTTCM